ncbi:cytochrome b/b6 domain-containing protein [Noviherbaspirillum pedocola]|uniref:Cytochrome b/b6 domain-containing protein n=1 Tax=Noviherbaspirillum pedocola TaxID=2801341 RepID=A0A934W8L4_9BURK|nr:cytochrome b/b6 domain-containing protein [Noviherbaspirillum pedocola]MBK4738777.1 cytochrome b/b6 domain-containing protein [Noviherbaspirillum pedocola]
MMWALLVLIGLHVAAALYHHFIRHDTILRRMLPGR